VLEAVLQEFDELEFVDGKHGETVIAAKSANQMNSFQHAQVMLEGASLLCAAQVHEGFC